MGAWRLTIHPIARPPLALSPIHPHWHWQPGFPSPARMHRPKSPQYPEHAVSIWQLEVGRYQSASGRFAKG